MDSEDSPWQTWVACVILGLSFLVGTPGNLLVIWTILRHIRPRSHTVLLILNLAAADLLVLITLPLWIYSLADAWVFGQAACKAMVYVIYACMYSSVFLISTMSVERCVAVLHPFALHGWRKEGVMAKVLAVIWVLAFVFSIPVILTHTVDEEDGRMQCTFRQYASNAQEIVCLVLETLLGFILPFFILSVCYSCVWKRIKQMTFKSKQKSTALIVSVVIAFALCWLPHHVCNVLSLVSLLLHGNNKKVADNLEDTRLMLHYISAALTFVSSSVNPVLYAFAARKLRSSFRDSGIRKLLRHISSSSMNEGTNELTFVSRRQSSQTDQVNCNTASSIHLAV
ncbi:LT4R1 protein, partial [Amia calva]|nr:LT4R1 protein [Amia calva]